MPSLCRLKPLCRAGGTRPVPAWSDSKLVGFVHAVWDGGHRAFVPDAAVPGAAVRPGQGSCAQARERGLERVRAGRCGPDADVGRADAGDGSGVAGVGDDVYPGQQVGRSDCASCAEDREPCEEADADPDPVASLGRAWCGGFDEQVADAGAVGGVEVERQPGLHPQLRKSP